MILMTNLIHGQVFQVEYQVEPGGVPGGICIIYTVAQFIRHILLKFTVHLCLNPKSLKF